MGIAVQVGTLCKVADILRSTSENSEYHHLGVIGPCGRQRALGGLFDARPFHFSLVHFHHHVSCTLDVAGDLLKIG